jgi:hypothetical protein
MKLLVVIPIQNFSIRDGFEFDFDGFKITNSKSIKEELYKIKEFVLHLGVMQINNIENSYIIYFKGDSSLLSLPSVPDTLFHIGDIISNRIPRFIDCLWFIKDNCCSTSVEYCMSLEDRRPEYRSASTKNSMADGSYRQQDFSIDELKECVHIFHKIMNLSEGIGDIPQIPKPTTTIITLKHPATFQPYTFNKIVIALNFLSHARSGFREVIKVTYMVAVLESLFSTKNIKNISIRIPQRAAAYLNTLDDDVLRDYNLIRSAYGIRSEYIHGNTIDLELDEMRKLSINLDVLIRRTFKKILRTDLYLFMPKERSNFGNYMAIKVDKFKRVFPPEPERKNNS